MSDVWFEVWTKKIGKAKGEPEPKSIPPATAAIHENVKNSTYTVFNIEGD